jgi:hypothetical protein
MMEVAIGALIVLYIWGLMELRSFRRWLEQIDTDTKRIKHQLENEKR